MGGLGVCPNSSFDPGAETVRAGVFSFPTPDQMTPLQRLELRILERLPDLNLRPSLDRAAEVGELLHEAKTLLAHGEWLQWLRRVNLNRRTANDYMAVSRQMHAANERPAATMTIKQFLTFCRQADRQRRQADRDELRADVASAAGDAPGLHHADCRAFDWPTVDAIATDPPWADLEAYRWLAGMAGEKLRDGGAVFVQSGTGFVPRVIDTFTGAGLSYLWTLAIVFKQAQDTAAVGRFRSVWKPVLVFTRGTPGFGPGSVSDTYTVTKGAKDYHDWEQPLDPWVYWLGRLLRPGSLVADPYAGSATVGVACRRVGLNYLGTEIDPDHYHVARGRLSSEPEATT